MNNNSPSGKKVIDALERLGFEMVMADDNEVTLSKNGVKITLPKDNIPESRLGSIKEQLRSIFAEYQKVPLARPIEKIKQWAQE